MTDFRKLLNIIQDNSSNGIEQYDCFDIELGEDLLIETGVLDVTEDSILLEADDKALELLAKHGIVLNEISEAKQLFPNWNDPKTKEFYDKPTFQRIKSGETEPVDTTDYSTPPKLREPQRTSFKNYEDWRRYQIAQLKKATESMSEGQLVPGPWLGSGKDGASVDELTSKFLKSSFNYSYLANDQKALDEITHDVRRFLLNLQTTNKAFKLPSGKSIEDLVKSISHKVHNSLTSETNIDLKENRRKKSPFNNPDELQRRAELKARDPNRSLLGKDSIYGNEYKQKDRYGDMYKIAGPKGELPENTDNDDLDKAKDKGRSVEEIEADLAAAWLEVFNVNVKTMQRALKKKTTGTGTWKAARGAWDEVTGETAKRIDDLKAELKRAKQAEKNNKSELDEAKYQGHDYPFTSAGSAVLNRIIRTQPELLKHGPEKVMDAVHTITDSLDDLEEIGTSDVSIWVDQVRRELGEPVDTMREAKYQGREVPLGKKMAGDVKKSKVYVRKPNGKVVKVNFGDKKMRIKKSNPKRRKSFRARHNCKNPGPRWKARYWSCRSW